MDETTAVATMVAAGAAMVAAGAAVASGVVSWLNRRDARSADLKGQIREGFAKADAERERLRSQMEEGLAKAESHREKQRAELLADRREWSAVHESASRALRDRPWAGHPIGPTNRVDPHGQMHPARNVRRRGLSGANVRPQRPSRGHSTPFARRAARAGKLLFGEQASGGAQPAERRLRLFGGIAFR